METSGLGGSGDPKVEIGKGMLYGLQGRRFYR
jgi:hypothetical protein